MNHRQLFLGHLLALVATLGLSQAPPNIITQVDRRVSRNQYVHHTDHYQQFALRRGDPIEVSIFFQHNFDQARDQVRVEFATGTQPQVDKKTLIYFPLEQEPSQNATYTAKLISGQGNKVDVILNTPPTMAVGKWQLRFSTRKVDSYSIYTHVVNEPVYMLFNAWHPQDQVYIPREDARQEYLVSETGKIYIGTHASPSSRVWHYNQFKPSVLPTMIVALEKTRIDIKGRSDVVKVARAISAAVNSHDEQGLLVGNWSGSYSDGAAPWQWTDSSVIFDRYLAQNYQPVRFAQCWVFGGVLTTALRTIGIPARSISNFMSAHDTDTSLTVDKFYGDRGEELKGVNGDSIWNFHVWVDAWMRRDDLPPGYGGWQAVDSTPQEKSMGIYQLGPASLEAIKQGRVDFAYDVGFVYSEVNADVVHWHLDRRHSPPKWRRSNVIRGSVGRLMLTKQIGVFEPYPRYHHQDQEDITLQYKYREGSHEERESYERALRLGGIHPSFSSK